MAASIPTISAPVWFSFSLLSANPLLHRAFTHPPEAAIPGPCNLSFTDLLSSFILVSLRFVLTRCHKWHRAMLCYRWELVYFDDCKINYNLFAVGVPLVPQSTPQTGKCDTNELNMITDS